MNNTKYMQDAQLVAHKLSELKTHLGAYPTEIKITNGGAFIDFKMWSSEDEPEEGHDDDRGYNLDCSTDDLLKHLEQDCREAGVYINMNYYYCELRNERHNGIYVNACIDLTNTSEGK